MKIGDGGLQSMATYDDVSARQLQEQHLRKPDGTENLQQERGTALQIDEDALNKAVEKLNENARSHNLPLDFAVKKEDGKTLVHIKNNDSEQERDVQPRELPRLLQGMVENKGLIIDQYF